MQILDVKVRAQRLVSRWAHHAPSSLPRPDVLSIARASDGGRSGRAGLCRASAAANESFARGTPDKSERAALSGFAGDRAVRVHQTMHHLPRNHLQSAELEETGDEHDTITLTQTIASHQRVRSTSHGVRE